MPIKLDTWGQFVFIMADPSRCCSSFPVKPTFRMHAPTEFSLISCDVIATINAVHVDLLDEHRQGSEMPRLVLMTCAW